jgi:hypothetical protein
MKNLVLVFTFLMAITFASCSHSTSNEVPTVDSTEVVTDSIETVDSLTVDSLAVDSVL